VNKSNPTRAGAIVGLLFSLASGVADGGSATAQDFVRRSGTGLLLNGRPYLCVGANAYYLQSAVAYGSIAGVQEVLSGAAGSGLSVVRTWAFHDSPDSSDPAVLQVRPGGYSEAGLRALDKVIALAKTAGIRLILPLVNGWDDYGGMNQYVRWRSEGWGGAPALGKRRYDDAEVNEVVRNGRGGSYRLAQTAMLGHDDFYTDPRIRSWYKQYVAMIIQRVNTVTGVANRDEPAILAWELANEPRSSDRSGETVRWWLAEMSAFVKSLDGNHLVGSGEEGMDISAAGYPATSQEAPAWLFDGSAGISFLRNTAIPFLDFASIHLYSDSWGLPAGGGNSWIREHARGASTESKPLVLGEFGVRTGRRQVFESWLTTSLLDGVTGALAWQLLDASRTDSEGYGFYCPADAVCGTLHQFALLFEEKARTGGSPPPAAIRVFPGYPNPLSAQATVMYDLPWESEVTLELYDMTGARVLTAVRDVQTAGVRRELMDVRFLASGAYVYRLEAVSTGSGERRTGSGRLMVLH
jgi:mannan endo-1,4-beta-mannosidase